MKNASGHRRFAAATIAAGLKRPFTDSGRCRRNETQRAVDQVFADRSPEDQRAMASEINSTLEDYVRQKFAGDLTTAVDEVLKALRG